MTTEEQPRKPCALRWDDDGAVPCKHCKTIHYFADLRQIWVEPIRFPNAPDMSSVQVLCTADSKWYTYDYKEVLFPTNARTEIGTKMDELLRRIGALEIQVGTLNGTFDAKLVQTEERLKKFVAKCIAEYAPKPFVPTNAKDTQGKPQYQ